MILQQRTHPIRLLAVMEANTITGPARNLIQFSVLAREQQTLKGRLPIETRIVTFQRPDGAKRNSFVEFARDSGIDVDVIEERFRFDTRVLGALAAVIRQRSPHVIQTHNVKSHFLMRLAAGSWTIPWVAYHHGYTVPDMKMRVYNHLDSWSLPRASRIITMNSAFAESLSQTGIDPKRIRVVHNSVPVGWLERFEGGARDAMRAEARKQINLAATDRVVLSVGRLSREKGHSALLEACALLRASRPTSRVKLVIVGDGPERGRIEQAARAGGISADVRLAGHVQDVAKFYAMADVFMLPSHSEGSPNALLEAMGAGLPAVASATGGVPEILTNGVDGLLVPSNDPARIAEAISIALTDPRSSSFAENAKQTVRQRFSPEARVRSLVEIYGELLGRQASVTAKVA